MSNDDFAPLLPFNSFHRSVCVDTPVKRENCKIRRFICLPKPHFLFSNGKPFRRNVRKGNICTDKKLYEKRAKCGEKRIEIKRDDLVKAKLFK